ncbi:MAG TPA: hypothetical protein PK156_22850, partial [Polyangium sp.]|nr:hypothetical protein [Polyangium sp.]
MIHDDLRMSVRQSRAIAGAVALFAFAAVVLEVALVRMFSTLLGHHFGAAWVVVMPLGLGLGALLGIFVQRRARAPFSVANVAHWTAFAAPCAALAVIVGVRAKGVDNFDTAALQQILLFLGTSTLPFVIAGLTFAHVLGASQRHASGLLRTVFAAAACAWVASAFVMRFGPARVGLGVAVTISLAAVLFARAAHFDERGPQASSSLVATFVLGTSVVLAGEIGAPYLKLASLRWIGLDKTETQIWTANGFYTVDKPQSNSALIRVDGTYGRSIPDNKQTPPVATDELPYLFDKGTDPVLIVGAGGGREIRAALRQSHHDIQAIEEDITIARAIMRGSSYAFSDSLYDKPEVHVTLGGAKTYVRSRPNSFQRIIVGYYDTQAAAPSGSLATRPTLGLTTEFIQDLLNALRPDGTLTILRPDPELDRLVALLAHALRTQGSRSPGMHMFGCGRDKLTTVLAKRSPWQADELSTLRTHCRRHKFTEVVSPDAVKDESRQLLMTGRDPSAAPIGQTTDLRPPTEDRPFWFYSVTPTRLVSTLRNYRGLIEHHRSLLVISAGLALSLVLGLLVFLFALVAPSRLWGYESRISVTRMSMTLACMATTTVLFGYAFIGRFEPIIGRPDIVALFFPLVFLLALALGAGLAGRFDDDDARAGLQRWLLATTFVLAPLLMALDGILGTVVDLTLPLRILVPSAILACVGTGLGVGIGLGVRIAASWGLRTTASVFAQACIAASTAILVGLLVSMNLGYSAVLLVASATLLLAIIFAASAHVVTPEPPTFFQPLSSHDTADDDEPISFRNHGPSSSTSAH